MRISVSSEYFTYFRDSQWLVRLGSLSDSGTILAVEFMHQAHARLKLTKEQPPGLQLLSFNVCSM
jgi:hypothetical protein